MGVFDVAGAAITGGLDNLEMHAIPDQLEERIKAMPPRIQIEEDGTLVDVQGELLALVQEMRDAVFVFERNQIDILKAL